MKCLGCRALDDSKWWIIRDLEENIIFHILMRCKFIRMKNARKVIIACFRKYNSNSGLSQWEARKFYSNIREYCFKTVLNGSEVPSIQISSAWVTRKMEPACTGITFGPLRFRCRQVSLYNVFYIYIYIYIYINYACYNYWTSVRYCVD